MNHSAEECKRLRAILARAERLGYTNVEVDFEEFTETFDLLAAGAIHEAVISADAGDIVKLHFWYAGKSWTNDDPAAGSMLVVWGNSPEELVADWVGDSVDEIMKPFISV